MRILIISQYYYPDPFRLQDVAEGLANRGHSVTVLTGTPNYVAGSPFEDKKNDCRTCTINGVTIIRVKTYRRKTSLKSIALSYASYTLHASLAALKMKGVYDVVFVYQLSPILMAVPAFIYARKKKRKIALYCLDLWPESMIGMGITHDHLLYKFMRLFSRYVYNHVDYLGYTSKLFEDYFQNDLKLYQKRYKYIPQFAEDLYQDIGKKEHAGINYVFAGNIGESQNVENIIRAAKLVKDERVKWHIVGDGRNLEKCMLLAQQMQLQEKVIFYGRRPISEMPFFYSIADAMVVTLDDNKIISYTLPGKVQSYMAAGKAIIGAATGEIPLIMSEAECGLCCEPNSPSSLARIAENMANADRSQYELKSKKYYLEHFTKDKHILEIEKMLESLCD